MKLLVINFSPLPLGLHTSLGLGSPFLSMWKKNLDQFVIVETHFWVNANYVFMLPNDDIQVLA